MNGPSGEAAASQVQGATEVGADVESLVEKMARVIHSVHGQPHSWDVLAEAGQVEWYSTTARATLKAVIAAGWVPAERVEVDRPSGPPIEELSNLSTLLAEARAEAWDEGWRTTDGYKGNPYRIAERGESP